MPDTLTTNVLLTNQTEGGNDNTWGIKVDDNFELIDNLMGDVTEVVTTGGTTTLTDEQELVMAIRVTGTLVSDATVELSGRGGRWVIANSTTGAFSLTVKVTGQTGITVQQGTAILVWCDGTDILQGVPTAEVLSDQTPQLGGDLDTNGHQISFDDSKGILDDSGNEQLIFHKTGAAVNQFGMTNAATGNAPLLAPEGGDTDIDLDIRPKGAGKLKSNTSRIVALAASTAMLFVQTAAPTGWTKSVAHNDKALRVVSGAASSGGSAAFTTAFASRTPAGTVGDTTLTVNQIPSHGHPFRYCPVAGQDSDPTGGMMVASNGSNVNKSAFSGTASDTAGEQIGGTGGDQSHTHTFAGTAMDFAVAYIDCIIATLD